MTIPVTPPALCPPPSLPPSLHPFLPVLRLTDPPVLPPTQAFASQNLRPAGGGAGGPPPWVPFGKSISAAHKAERDFKVRWDEERGGDGVGDERDVGMGLCR